MTPRAKNLLTQAQNLSPTEKLGLIDGLLETFETLDDCGNAGDGDASAADAADDELTGIFPMP